MVHLVEKLSILNLDDIISDVINDIMDDVIHCLKSYIRGSNRFYGTQHSMISLSIHRFGSGLFTDPQVIIYYYYHLLVTLFDLINLY